MTSNVVEATAVPSKLDRAVARMVDDDATLTDISAVLQLLGQSDDVDGVRIQALCHLAARALGRFDADTRTAPPAALAAIVKDARQECCNALNGCDEYVLPWIFDGTYCSPTCRSEYMRSQGEVWSDR